MADSLTSPRGNRVEEARKTLSETSATPQATPSTSSEEAASEAGLSLEERVARAKKLLNAKRAAKQFEEEEVIGVRWHNL